MHTYIARLFVSELAQALNVCGPPEKQDSAPSTSTSEVKISACGCPRGICPCKPRDCAAQRKDCAPFAQPRAPRPRAARVLAPGQQQRKRGACTPTCALGGGGPGGGAGRGAGGGICCWGIVCGSFCQYCTEHQRRRHAARMPRDLHFLARELHITHAHLLTLRVLAPWEHLFTTFQNHPRANWRPG